MVRIRGKIKLKDVLYAPNISKNIVSLRKVLKAGVKVGLTNKGIQIISEKHDQVIKESPFDGRFWYLNFKKSENSSDSDYCLHSTLPSKNKTQHLG